MSLLFYKVLHMFAITMLFTVGGGIALHAANGGDKAGNKVRGLVGILHGIALVLSLVSGFAMLAKLGFGFDQGWVWAKLVLWVLFGGIFAIPYRKPELAKPFLVLLPILGAVAAYLALYKPF